MGGGGAGLWVKWLADGRGIALWPCNPGFLLLRSLATTRPMTEILAIRFERFSTLPLLVQSYSEIRISGSIPTLLSRSPTIVDFLETSGGITTLGRASPH